MRFGVQLSISNGLLGALAEAREFGCETFQIFSRNPRGRGQKDPSDDVVADFRAGVAALGVKNFFIHAPYYINLASSTDKTWHASVTYALDELKRTERLGSRYFVAHMGSHTGAGREAGMQRMAEALEKVFAAHTGTATLLLETTAGQGTQLGDTFEDIAQIVHRFSSTGKIGVALDTQHTFAAGYDWTAPDGPKTILDQFDKIIGLKHLHLIHLNDSETPLGSRKDRHEHIGKGLMGLAPFFALAHDPRLATVDAVVESHGAGRAEDMRLTKALREAPDVSTVHVAA